MQNSAAHTHTNTTGMTKLLDDLRWRYAAKKYSSKKVAKTDLDQIVEAINLSASSFGLQTYRLLVIENPELRKKLGNDPIATMNPQIVEASHLLVFAAFDALSQANIDHYIEIAAKERNMHRGALADYSAMMASYLLPRTNEDIFLWSAKQAYIGLGTGLIAAATLKIDTTPMEGFDPASLDAALGLKEKGLKSVVLLALGYRDEANDYLANLRKVRLPQAEFATYID
jgi:nitroreductase / dihydropteridine reductase